MSSITRETLAQRRMRLGIQLVSKGAFPSGRYFRDKSAVSASRCLALQRSHNPHKLGGRWFEGGSKSAKGRYQR